MVVRLGLCLVGAFIAGVLGGVAFAAPPEADPFPELKKKAPPRELTVFDRAVIQAAGDLRHGDLRNPGPDAVAFSLWLYREEDDRKYLDWATGMAREMLRAGPVPGAVAALYRTAQAGGLTRVEAEDAFRRRQEEASTAGELSTLAYADLVLDFFARAAFLDTRAAVADALMATGSFWQARTRKEGNALRLLSVDGKPEGLGGHVAALRVGIEATALSGSGQVREECRLLAHEILGRFWNEAREGFADPDAPVSLSRDAGVQAASASDARVLRCRAALAVWEMGMVCGDQLLIGRGQRALEGGLADALADPLSAPSAGLAAGRLSRHPVQMALVGEPADPTLVALRQAAYTVFEPSKLMLSLDPAADAARFAESLYPAELAPALFICVETVCSPPVTKAEGLKDVVKEIRKLAKEAGG